MSEGSDIFVTGDYCNPPTIAAHRGVYFDGTNSIELKGMYLYSSYSFGIWARPAEGDGTLLSYQYTLWEGWDEWDRSLVDEDQYRKFYELPRFNQLYLSHCNNFRLKSDQTNSDDEDAALAYEEADWSFYGLVETSDFDGSDKTLMLNYKAVSTESSTAVITGPPNTKMFLGSFDGLIKHLKGFIWSFEYYVYPLFTPEFGVCDGHCDICPIGGCLPICDMHEYIGEDGTCFPCHFSCTQGCIDLTPCVENGACDKTCKTCNGPNPDQCLSCWCGAQLHDKKTHTGSTCECKDNYIGPADDCTIDCYEGCDVCRDTGPDDCVRCKENYHLVTNTLIHNAQGYCEWCFEDLYDRYPTCRSTEWNDEQEICMCEPGQWFDTQTSQCRFCSHHCVQCKDIALDTSGMHCMACEEGFYFLPNSDICVSNCPSGFNSKKHVKTCVGTGHFVIDLDFEFRDRFVVERNWLMHGNYEDEVSGESIQWETKIFGGAKEASIDGDDPYIMDSRGLWFDGMHQFLTVKSLLINHSFKISSWVKPHGAGTIFSTTNVNETNGKYNRSLFWGMDEETFRWADTYHHSYTNFGEVQLFDWQYVDLVMEWDQAVGMSEVTFSKNNVETELKEIQYITLDFPESFHIIGGIRKETEVKEYYKGFMFSFKLFNDIPGPDITDDISDSCQPCIYCPSSLGECLGICNWNYSWNRTSNKCERCSHWCSMGCEEDGTC